MNDTMKTAVAMAPEQFKSDEHAQRWLDFYSMLYDAKFMCDGFSDESRGVWMLWRNDGSSSWSMADDWDAVFPGWQVVATDDDLANGLCHIAVRRK